MSARSELDVITREIIWNGLLSAAREMGVTMRQTSVSPIFNEGNDYSCGIFDRDSRLVCHGEFLPIHLGSLPYSVRYTIEEIGVDHLSPGDTVVLNDPFRGGSHLPDVTMVTPIFVGGEIVAFGANRAHHLDVGGTVPGSFYAGATENYQEGLRIPPVKLMRRGRLDDQIMRFILANVRLPDQMSADLQSQVSANLTAVRRVLELYDRYGGETVRQAMDEIMDHSERRIRSIIATWPDGEYVGEDAMDNDGIEDRPRVVRVTVRVRGDELDVDMTGSSPQATGPLNSVLGYTASAVYMTIQAATDPAIEPNDGCYRPVTIIAPEGTVVNPRFPAACTGGNELTHIIHMATFRALAEIPRVEGHCPRVIACDQGSSNNLLIAGHDGGGKRYVLYEYPEGGWGAPDGKDGLSAVFSIVGNTWNIPAEVVEMRFPIRVERYELRADSGGAGRWRGGLGVRRNYEVLSDRAELSIMGNRAKIPPWGLFGGRDGGLASYVINEGRPDERLAAPEFLSKGSGIALREGDVVCQSTAGGGGFGEPFLRDPQAVARDVRLGYVSPAAARNEYGVILDSVGEADVEQTRRYRAGEERMPAAERQPGPPGGSGGRG
jgi:N-methylhydantoinase B